MMQKRKFVSLEEMPRHDVTSEQNHAEMAVSSKMSQV